MDQGEPAEDSSHDMKGQQVETAELITYLLGTLHRDLGRTRLLKLLYLADLEARKYLGHPISRLHYRRYLHGPFDSAIYRAIEHLVDHGAISAHEHRGPERDRVLVKYRLTRQRPERRIPATYRSILDYVAREFGARPMQALLQHVYSTPPMEGNIPIEAPLPMNRVDRIGIRALGGIDLNTLLRAESDRAAGRARPLDEARRELCG